MTDLLVDPDEGDRWPPRPRTARADRLGAEAQRLVLLRALGELSRREIAARFIMTETNAQHVIAGRQFSLYTGPIRRTLERYGITRPNGGRVPAVERNRGAARLYRDLLVRCIELLATHPDPCARALAREARTYSLAWVRKCRGSSAASPACSSATASAQS